MNEAPKGKIGRLPKAIQDQVNRRLENGEKARTLVAWLNAQPEVQAMLAAEFGGKPIREQNLSEWRKYGYKQWLWHQQALAMTQEMASPLSHPVPDQMAGWVTARNLFAIRQLVEDRAGGEPDFKTLRAFLHDVVAVRRGDHAATRLQLASERLADKRKDSHDSWFEAWQGEANRQRWGLWICPTRKSSPPGCSKRVRCAPPWPWCWAAASIMF